MNKYARIDKIVCKGDIYRVLWLAHNMTPGQIASRFGITTIAVCKAMRASYNREASAPYSADYIKRVSQLAWTYAY